MYTCLIYHIKIGGLNDYSRLDVVVTHAGWRLKQMSLRKSILINDYIWPTITSFLNSLSYPPFLLRSSSSSSSPAKTMIHRIIKKEAERRRERQNSVRFVFGAARGLVTAGYLFVRRTGLSGQWLRVDQRRSRAH